MEWTPPDEVWRVSGLWTDPGGNSWILVFSLIHLGGRLECVGLSIRSYARRAALRRGFWVETYGTRPMDVAEFDDDVLLKGIGEAQMFELTELQENALHKLAAGAELAPVPLKSTTLRELPFFGMLSAARLEQARETRADAEWICEQEDLDQARAEVTAGMLEAGAAELERPRGKPSKRKRGRPPKYTTDDLKRVADTYLQTWQSGSSAPTKAVREAFGYSASQAEKLVAKCRRLGLIPPTGPSRKSGQS